MSETHDTLSQAILRILRAEGLSQRDSSRIAKTNEAEITRIKQGHREFKVTQLELIAEHFKIPVGVLLLKAMQYVGPTEIASERLRELIESVKCEVDEILARRRSGTSNSVQIDESQESHEPRFKKNSSAKPEREVCNRVGQWQGLSRVA